MKITVVTAGLSTPSSTRLLADRLAEATVDRLPGARVDVVELRGLAHSLADHLLTGFPTGELATAIEQVGAADALIVVTPVFSSSYSGLFKTFFDVLEPELLAGKPVLLAATAGTARHSLVTEFAMRPLFAYLKAVPVPTAVFAASEDFGGGGLGDLGARVERAATELASMLLPGPGGAPAPVVVRRDRPAEQEFDDPTPFGDVLARLGQA